MTAVEVWERANGAYRTVLRARRDARRDAQRDASAIDKQPELVLALRRTRRRYLDRSTNPFLHETERRWYLRAVEAIDAWLAELRDAPTSLIPAST